jgi:hypothetical protein
VFAGPIGLNPGLPEARFFVMVTSARLAARSHNKRGSRCAFESGVEIVWPEAKLAAAAAEARSQMLPCATLAGCAAESEPRGRDADFSIGGRNGSLKGRTADLIGEVESARVAAAGESPPPLGKETVAARCMPGFAGWGCGCERGCDAGGGLDLGGASKLLKNSLLNVSASAADGIGFREGLACLLAAAGTSGGR